MIESKSINHLRYSSYSIIGMVIFLPFIFPLVIKIWGLHGLVIPCIVTILLLLEAWRFQQAYKKLEIRSADDYYDLLKYGKKKDNHGNDESIQEFKKNR